MDKDNGKYWMVTLTLHLGEYEKTAYNVVYAADEDSAKRQALIDECHNEPEFKDDGYCWDGDFAYRVYACRPLSFIEFNVLKALNF